MQVGATSSSSINLLPVPVNRREDVAERSAEQRRQLVIEQPPEQTRQQREAVQAQRVRAGVETQQANNQAQEVLRDVAPRQRSALQSYLNNGPSIEERLGVDLAGIDVYA